MIDLYIREESNISYFHSKLFLSTKNQFHKIIKEFIPKMHIILKYTILKIPF